MIRSSEFIKHDESVQSILKLQIILENIAIDNYIDTLEEIISIFLEAAIVSKGSLVQNIIRTFSFRPHSDSLLMKLLLDINSISSIKKELEICVYYAYQLKLVDIVKKLFKIGLIEEKNAYSIINAYYRVNGNIEESKPNQIAETIRSDDFDTLQKMSSAPGFDFDSKITDQIIRAPGCRKDNLTLLQYAALCSSIKCFKFLILSHAKISTEQDELRTIDYAIEGGNLEIIRTLEQKGETYEPIDLKLAIEQHHNEIFDWLCDKMPDAKYSSKFSLFPDVEDEDLIDICVRSNFIYGLSKFDKINVQRVFDVACWNRNTEIAISILNNHKILINNGLVGACRVGALEIVKAILSQPSVDPNSNYISDQINEEEELNDIISFPLNEACRTGQIEIVKILLDHDDIQVNKKVLFIFITQFFLMLLYGFYCKQDAFLEYFLLFS